jgi:subtilisin-like proprotein convertase family protein
MLRLLTFGMRCFFVFVAVAAIWTSVNAQTFTGPGFPINDNNDTGTTGCSTITVSGVTSNRFVASVTLTGISHTFIGDLEVRLYPPSATDPPAFGTTDAVLLSTDASVNCNFGGTYRFTDVAATSLETATLPCVGQPAGTDNFVVPSGDYRASNTAGTTISLFSTFGTLTPAQANGDWQLCVYDFATGDTGTVAGWSLQLGISPTAASVSVSGRVTAGKGQGLPGATVRITGPSGQPQTTLTNSMGYYNFSEVEAGSVYTVSVSNKGYTFDPSSIVLSVEDDVGDVNFTGVSTKKDRR